MKIKFLLTVFVLSSLLPANQLYCSELISKYYPLKNGMTWEYSVISDKAEMRKIQVTNLPAREISGVTVTPRKWDTGGMVKYYLIASDDKGIYRYGEQKEEKGEPIITKPKVYYIKNPVDNGTTWDIATKLGEDTLNVNLTIESTNDTVKVPAGTFKDCLKIKHAGDNQKNGSGLALEAYEWYAPDVGLVKSIVTIKKLEKGKPATSEHQTYQLESFKP